MEKPVLTIPQPLRILPTVIFNDPEIRSKRKQITQSLVRPTLPAEVPSTGLKSIQKPRKTSTNPERIQKQSKETYKARKQSVFHDLAKRSAEILTLIKIVQKHSSSCKSIQSELKQHKSLLLKQIA